MTLQANIPHQTEKTVASSGMNNGFFEKPSGGVAAQNYGGKWVYRVPEGKYAIVTIWWSHPNVGCQIYDKFNGQHYVQIGNFGNSSEDKSAKRFMENVRLYSGMSVYAPGSSTVSVVGCEYDL